MDRLLSNHEESLHRLEQVFDSLVRRVLSQSYRSIVVLEKGRFEFQVACGSRIQGEAFSTLVVLLSDVCAMILGGLGVGSHPGLLIHDSPREADLSQRVYHSLLTYMAELAAVDEASAPVPFQYIVTTTTAPPPDLQSDDTVRLCLSRAAEEKLLFRKDLGGIAEERNEQLQLGLKE